jgi:LacI family transcriptional regulator
MSPPVVALLIETSNAYARGLLRGIRNYVRERGPWSIYLGEHRRGEPVPPWLTDWRGDGVIARIETKSIARALQSLKIPTVDVSAARYVESVPYAETDDAAIARVAIEHLRDRGFRHLAFCGDARFRWSNNREESFREITSQLGTSCYVFPQQQRGEGEPSWESLRGGLARWIEELPRPIGIMAAYDIRGRQVLDVCRELSVQVPDEVAVIGVDNDELLCDFASPSLSSVMPDAARTGYEAASLLDRMMRGESVTADAILIEPLGVVTRGSTDVLAIDDPDISAAVRYIRQHATDGIQVSDVLARVPLSRRVLEARFKKLLGRTPHDEIERVRLDQVKRLLSGTELSLDAIARRTSFRHVEYMCVAFKRATGLPPGKYRQQHRT